LNCGPISKNRNATEAKILEAARRLFAHDSYDNVGIRDIASEAGVDSALIGRYFGSKEGLFLEALENGRTRPDFLEDGRSGMAPRAAEMLTDGPQDDDKLIDLLIMLNSAGSSNAASSVRDSIESRFHKPVACLLEGDHCDLRARLFGSVLMGLAISRTIMGPYGLSDEESDMLKARLTAILEDALAPF
jgi:AcrR family transcriptional regulator